MKAGNSLVRFPTWALLGCAPRRASRPGYCLSPAFQLAPGLPEHPLPFVPLEPALSPEDLAPPSGLAVVVVVVLGLSAALADLMKLSPPTLPARLRAAMRQRAERLVLVIMVLLLPEAYVPLVVVMKLTKKYPFVKVAG